MVCECRGTIEANINAVAHGTRTKQSVLQEAVDFFKADFISASHKQSEFGSSALLQHVLLQYLQPICW